MDLDINGTPKDLITKFFDCLVLLPNLKTLDIFSTNYHGVFLGLNRKSTKFHSIRELRIDEPTAELVWECPNVESVTIRGTLSSGCAALLEPRGKELKKLKRIVGVHNSEVERGKPKGTFSSRAPFP